MDERTIFVNNYIPYYPKKKDTLHDTLLINKYEKINENKKEYFNLAKVVNFDIINNECRQDPLENSVKYYQTIYKKNLDCARQKDKEDFISEAIKSRREDLYIKKDVINEHFRLEKDVINEHFRLTPELIKFKKKNKALFSSMHGRKKK